MAQPRVTLAPRLQAIVGLSTLAVVVVALLIVGTRLHRQTHRAAERGAVEVLDVARGIGIDALPAPRSDGIERLPQVRSMPLTEVQSLADDPWLEAVLPGLNPSNPSAAELIFSDTDEPRFRYARLQPDEQQPELMLVETVTLNGRGLQRDLFINKLMLTAAAIAAGLVALVVYWWSLSKLVLAPLNTLVGYANKVSDGDLHLRAEINTGDEFSELATMFNQTLESIKAQQDSLTAANKSLDLKLGELAESNEALDHANQIKSDFLANVSHELRTPLNSIMGFGEVLAESIESDRIEGQEQPELVRRRRYTQNIIISSQRLLDLINDLLDLAKIEAGRASVMVGPVSITDTCEGLVNLMKPEAEQRGVRLALRMQSGMPVVQTDAGKLQQVLFNFLSNAVKFTPKGGLVTLAASHQLTDDAESPGFLRLAVTDTGPGIAVEDHPRVFEKFNQLDPQVTREYGGTGLGLAISQELAAMLQGRINLDSKVGEGATFSLTIPVAPRARTNVLMPEFIKAKAKSLPSAAERGDRDPRSNPG